MPPSPAVPRDVSPDRPGDAAFVRAHTRPRRPALVPEVVLHVADDVVALWEALEQQRGSAPEEPPFWAAAWPGGQALARYLLDHPDTVAGRPVLDLGSGSGLVAVAAALAGADPVTASEIDPVGRAAVERRGERRRRHRRGGRPAVHGAAGRGDGAGR